MKNEFIILPLLIICSFFSIKMAQGQDFVYTPKNPAFGGYYFNYQWMLNSANAQNDIKNPDKASGELDRFGRDPLQNFQNQINQQILGQISSSIVSSQFGTDLSSGQQGLDPGTYQFGTYTVDVGTTAEGISIIITDNSTGNSTEVIVPTF